MRTTTQAKKYSYLGVDAMRFEVRDAGEHGLRVIIHHWLADAVGQEVEHPAGTIEARLVKGNFTGRTGQSLGHRVYAPGTSLRVVHDEALAWMDEQGGTVR